MTLGVEAESGGSGERTEASGTRRLLPWLIGLMLACGACSSGDGTVRLEELATDVQDVEVFARTEIAFKPPDLTRINDGQDWRTANTPEVKADMAVADLSCDPGPAGFGCPCTGNQDCASAWCVLHLGDQVCSKTCVEECPDGWSCDPASGPDPVFVCTSLHPSLCLPCETSTACAIHGGGKCVRYSDLTGAFCGSSCGAGTGCPPGYECAGATTVEGQESQQCIHELGECSCSALAIAEELQTSCLAANEIGSCSGWRVCGAIGLADCDAPEPAPEVCDGIDNDCNGITDEDVDCDDDNECTDDVCNGTDGCDQVLLSGVPCFDDDACTYDDHCQSGECVGAIMVCDDGNVCTDDDCDPAEGCQHPFNQAECDDDGNPCTLNLCEDGLCMHPPVEDGNACNDGDPCSPDDQCLDGVCTWKSIDPECVPCGDGKCVYTESAESCPQDCGWCGDGICGLPENGPNGGTCPKDCLTPCGNGICEGGETADICKVDCGGCGDDFCGLNESHDSCPNDCPPTCGDGNCQADESPDTCPVDCMPPCGDGICETGENTVLCPVDCAVCGDDVCGKDEDKETCAMDCATACGNGKCEGGETGAKCLEPACSKEYCPQDCGYCGDKVCGFTENGDSCPSDCLAKCGDGKCQEDLGEEIDTCPADCIADKDGDQVQDAIDNCPFHHNPSQSDADQDGAGDACDPDDDNDGDQDMTDCAPLDAAVSHLVEESCNGQDDDCDLSIDEEDAQGCEAYFLDIDDDGYGVESKTKCLCVTGDFFSAKQAGDCMPFDPDSFPGAQENCDGLDNNCSGETDEGADCSDGVQCTTDVCSGVQGCVHTAKPTICDDGNDCTDDTCDLELGCINTPNAISCTSDNNQCTTDICQEAGCTHPPVPDGKLCEDDSICTLEDVCDDGQCMPGPALQCDDGQQCTDDWCNETLGCQYQENCPVGQVCDGAGECCKPAACGMPGLECGAWPNGCGATMECGECEDGEDCHKGVCSDGQCGGEFVAGLGGWANVVVVSENTAYMGFESGEFRVVNVSDKSSPVSVGACHLPAPLSGISIASDYAFVTAGFEGVLIVNVADPANPHLAASLQTPAKARDIQVVSDLAYVADEYGTFLIVDISDPTDPVLLGSCMVAGAPTAVKVLAGYAYVTAYEDGLQVIDVSDPTDPLPVAGVATVGEAWHLDLSADHAFVADGIGDLQIMSLQNQTNPAIVTSHEISGQARRCHLVSDLVYVAAHPFFGVEIISVADPGNPEKIGSYAAPWVSDIWATAKYSYAATGPDALLVHDVSNPANPQPVGSHRTLSDAHSLSVRWPHAFVADKQDRLHVIDVTAPGKPALISTIEMPGDIGGVYATSSHIYVGNKATGVRIFEFDGLGETALVGEFETGGLAEDIFVSSGLAYVARGSGLLIVSVDDPSNPVAIGSHDTPGHASQLVVSSGHALVADGTAGLQVISVADPMDPHPVTNFETDSALDVAVLSHHAFVLDETNPRIRVLDVSNPVSLVAVGDLDVQGNARAIKVAGSCLFVAMDQDGMSVVDLTNPAAPISAAVVDTPGGASDVEISSGYAYVADDRGGLLILDVSGCWGD